MPDQPADPQINPIIHQHPLAYLQRRRRRPPVNEQAHEWQLIAPTVRLHAAWLEAHNEWGPGLHEDGFGLRATDEVDTPAGFATWVARLTGRPDPAQPTIAGQVRSTCRWIVGGSRVLGGIALRHQLDDASLALGHIGYGIRPSARRQGLATWALGRMLSEAGSLGLERVLIVCAAGNIASAKTIERNGGALENIRDAEFGTVRRYWITIS